MDGDRRRSPVGMNKQQIHRAQSPAFIVLLLALSSVLGMKTCRKTTPSPATPAPMPALKNDSTTPNKDSLNTSSVFSVAPAADSSGTRQLTNHPDTAAKAKNTVPATIRTPKQVESDSSAMAIPATTKRDTIEPMPVLDLEVLDEDTSQGVTAVKDTVQSAETFFTADTSGKALKNTTASNDKLLSNTGTSYYSSQVQSNLNDQINSTYTTKLLYDSLIASSNKEFVYNTLTINNTTGSKLSMQVMIASPAGWSMVTSNMVDVTLEPFSSSIIPMRFSASGNNTANWQQVRIEYRINNVIDSRKTFFKIRVQEYSGFKASLPNSNLMLTSYQKNVSIPIMVRNSGNTPGTFIVAANNNLLKLSFKTSIVLQPGKDTNFMVSFPLSETVYSMLRKEDVRISVTNDKGEAINMIQSFSKVGHLVRDHISAYLDMPLQLEAGVNVQGTETPAQYYAALYGTVDFDEHNHFSMALRSNTIAKGQTNDNSIVRFNFSGEHIKASLGNIQGIGEFIIDGYGARLGYEWKGVNKAELYGMFRSRTGDAKVFGAALQTGIRNRIRINDALSMSFDKARQRNSGIITQITEIKFTDGKLALITGGGMEQNNAPLKEGTNTTLAGSTLGYQFNWVTKRLTAISNVLYNSNSFPGIFRGQRLQNHDVRWAINRLFVGGFYEYNYRKQNYFQDSLLFTNVFNIKSTNYGLRTGLNFKAASIILAAGNQKQTQEGDTSVRTDYNYLNLVFSTFIAKAVYFNLVSFAGVNRAVGRAPDDKAFVSSTQGTIQYKKTGVSFRYDNGPYYYQEFVAFLKKREGYDRIMISPFTEVSLWKSSFNGRFQANYARSMPGDLTSMNVLATINYSHPVRGFDFNLTAIAPFGPNTSVNNTYVSAALRVRLKAPFVAVRRFYDLKLILFKDANSNGKKDEGEEPVAGQTISLNGDLFVSDGEGLIVYKNTEKGVYKADFGFSSKLKGWIPNDGTTQEIELKGNRTIEVPYKTSRVLSGKLIVEKDSLSNVSFNPNNIKVMATGEKGEKYSTLTDDNGEFYFNLPAGIYIVSLSETAFPDQFKPVQFSQSADMANNQNKILYFEIRQKKRQINIKKK